MSIVLTDSAADRIKTLCAQNNKPMVRLAVDGGGCNGLSYEWGFADEVTDQDTVIEHNGAKLVVDYVSFPFMPDAKIDFVNNMGGASFKIDNPLSVSSCGCGTSFSIG